MINHILVPIDFSDTALNAVEEAAFIAKKQNARITLLHSYLIPGYTGGMAYETFMPSVDEHIGLINKQMNKFALEIPALTGITVEKAAIPGSIKDVIGAYAEENKVDLVVTGTRGASGFKAFLLGTQSERIGAEVKCPVLVLPEGKRIKRAMKLAIAHDYKSTLTESQVELLKNFQIIYDLAVTVVHVEDQKENLKVDPSIKENLKLLNPTFNNVVNEDVEKGLNEFIKDKYVDIVSIVYHDHGFMDRIFGRSTTRQLTYHTTTPLLVLK